ncbi:hypothetical protein [Nocardioides houyundeii]|uniref:hypothetical protein n=1 Tax=Nocardioides houyundeii TaxID=2045452 RepID=UPI00131566DA|nr:hypothetical protein [Nocardioides houyundeii]
MLKTSAEEELFFGLPQLRAPYRAFADSLPDGDAPRIGLADGMWQWEFPLWWLVKRAHPDAVLGNATPCPETVADEQPTWDAVVTWRDLSGEDYTHPGGCAH